LIVVFTMEKETYPMEYNDSNRFENDKTMKSLHVGGLSFFLPFLPDDDELLLVQVTS
jgi:hypothetical protein